MFKCHDTTNINKREREREREGEKHVEKHKYNQYIRI